MGSQSPELATALKQAMGLDYDPTRRTGKSTRMLLAAAHAMLTDKKHIIIVAGTRDHAMQLKRRLIDILKAAGVTLQDDERISIYSAADSVPAGFMLKPETAMFYDLT